MTAWRELAAQLTTSMPDTMSPRWRDAIATTPRHTFVPAIYLTGRGRVPADDVDVLYQAYQDIPLFLAAQPRPGSIVHVRAPSVVAGLIQDLDVREGQRVLEIGLDHGYSTALLAHVLGDDATFAVDPNPAAVDDSRTRLADTGHRPQLTVGEGLPAHGPYDRILVTDDITRVPWDWAEQLTPDGQISVDLSFGSTPTSGGRVVLRRTPDGLSGHFSPVSQVTMPSSRRVMAHPRPNNEPHDQATADKSTTTLDPQLWDIDSLWLMFLASTRRRDLTIGMIEYDDGDRYFIADTHGSWAEIERVEQERRRMRETAPHIFQPDPDIPPYTGPRQVWQAGSSRLWTEIERTHQIWTDLGQPALPDLGLTVTPDRQWIWLDSPGRNWQADL
jgi:protein-L-isoaspartate O-methyltransferase